ncbi:hypothetical protein LCGC14_2539310 [marine sediment metagenome]|uniref:HEAT repeat domain-containing protein n=1 Tax=marine sediment metagenome TaxID=412755 RepID=A0A0F9AR76_9ZZZZ
MDPTDRTNAKTIASKRSLWIVTIHSFVVIPFIIACVGLIVFIFFRLLTTEEQTIYDYLNDVKTGSSHRSWQAAFELSKHLLYPKDAEVHSKRFVNEMIGTFVHFGNKDKRIRQYLALAMGRTDEKQFVEPLLDAMAGEEGDTLVAIIQALGLLKDEKSGPHLYNYLDNPNSKVRLSAVIALGNIGDPASAEALKRALRDSEVNVVWDASVALAKIGRRDGKSVLLRLLDRSYLSKFTEIDADEQSKILITAIKAATLISDTDFIAAIRGLSKNDHNTEVRAAAMKALAQKAN